MLIHVDIEQLLALSRTNLRSQMIMVKNDYGKMLVSVHLYTVIVLLWWLEGTEGR